MSSQPVGLVMHHIDPGFSPTGNPALDSAPVTNCKACHNHDGYAAYNNRKGGSDAKKLSTTPDGSGPYQLTGQDGTNSATFVRRDGYWNTAAIAGRPA